MRIRAIEIVSEALCCIGLFLIKVALHHAASKNVTAFKGT